MSDTGRVLWALDLDNNWPVAAHRIVAEESSELGEQIRVTAYGQRRTALSHPRGWWETEPGRLPVQEQDVHCGLDDGA